MPEALQDLLGLYAADALVLSMTQENRLAGMQQRRRLTDDLTVVDLSPDDISRCRISISGFPEGLRLALEVDRDWLTSPKVLPHSQFYKLTAMSSVIQVSSGHLLGVPVSVLGYTSLPSSHDLERMGVEVPEEYGLEIDEYVFLAAEDRSPLHQIFGFAAPVQGDVIESLLSDLEYLQDEAGLRASKSENYRLLIQVESDPRIGLNIGDLGRLYIFISDSDLRKGRFDRTIAAVQCS